MNILIWDSGNHNGSIVMDIWKVILVAFVGTLCYTSSTGGDSATRNQLTPPRGETAGIWCEKSYDRCENNGTCFIVSHPDGGYPTFCNSETCYKIIKNNLQGSTWKEAMLNCADMDGVLLGIDEEGELNTIHQHFKNNIITGAIISGEPLQFWTRGNDVAFKHNWVWALTRTAVSLDDILQNGNEDLNNCLALFIGHDSAHLQQQNCSHRKNFICEIPKQWFSEEKTFQCLCPPGYTGYRCEVEVEQACKPNRCTNNEKCFTRSGEPNFVCECTDLHTSGYNCVKQPDSDYQGRRLEYSLKTCYGFECTTGVYTSPNYPDVYDNNYEELYLIYIPQATSIYFKVDDFDLEEGKDVLYIGPSLVPHFYNDAYLINGIESFTLQSDTAWINFHADPSFTKKGFRLQWTSTSEEQPQIVSDSLTEVNITCEQDEVVFIQYAAYGQLSVEFLSNNEPCLDTMSLYKSAQRCNGLNSCSLKIKKVFLADPCPDVNKTLDFRYQCVSDNETYANLTYETVPGKTEDTPSSTDYCYPNNDFAIQWKRVIQGNFDIQNCSAGMDGLASRHCSSSAIWSNEPDFSLCVSKWVEDIQSKIASDVPAILIAKEVQSITNSSSANMQDTEGAARELTRSVHLLASLVKLQSNQLLGKTPKERVVTVTEFSEAFLQVGSNLLDIGNKDIWLNVQQEGANTEEQETSKTTLLPTIVTEDLEDTAFLLASQLLGNSSRIMLESENIVMGTEVISATNEDGNITFVFNDFLDEREKNTIMLPISAIKLNTSAKDIHAAFFFYKTLGELFSTTDEQATFAEQDQTNDSKTMKLNSSETINISRQINSHIISAVVNTHQPANRTEHLLEGDNKVVFTLQHRNKNLTGNVSCVFWNYKNVSTHGSASKGHSRGYWSLEGCHLIRTNSTQSTCACHHLTNFAIMLDVEGTHSKISVAHEIALGAITIIGCTISIVCLGLCVFVFTYFKSLYSMRTMIHRNLCLSLLIAELVFLLGVDKTQHQIACAVIAGVLHYAFLAAFFWMFLEALQFYIMLVYVFSNTESRRWMYYVTGYGLPLIIVGVTAGVKYDGYGTDKYCWLSTEANILWSFAGILAVIISVNFVLLFVALYKAYNARAQLSKKASSNRNLRPWIKGALNMLFLLGCTWGAGFLSLLHPSPFIAYLFTILNSLQGMFIFVFYCLGNERVVAEMRKLVGRQQWLPLWFRKRNGPVHKGVTVMCTLDTKTQQTNIPSVMIKDVDKKDINNGKNQKEKSRSWLYSKSGAYTINEYMAHDNPCVEPDYD